MLMHQLDSAIEAAEDCLDEIIGDTPAKVLTSIPHIGVVRASNYGGAVGDIGRFTGADQLYKLSGLVPKLYESAGKRRGGLAISRAGKVVLREAILEARQGASSGSSRLRRLRPLDEAAGQARRGGPVRSGPPGQPAGVRHDAGPG